MIQHPSTEVYELFLTEVALSIIRPPSADPEVRFPGSVANMVDRGEQCQSRLVGPPMCFGLGVIVLTNESPVKGFPGVVVPPV